MWHLNPLNALKQIIHYSQIQNKIARSTKSIPHIYNLNKLLSFYNYLCLIKRHPTQTHCGYLGHYVPLPFLTKLNNQELLLHFRIRRGEENSKCSNINKKKKKTRWINYEQNYEVSPWLLQLPFFSFPLLKSNLQRFRVLLFTWGIISAVLTTEF